MGHTLSPLQLRAVLGAAFWMALTHASLAGSMTFLAPRDVSVRHNGGTLTRGTVKSITPDEVVVVSRGVEKSIAISAVTSIIASDSSFKYYPLQDTFDEFLAKSAGLKGVTIVRDTEPGGSASPADSRMIGGVSAGYARAIAMQPAATPQSGSSSGGFVQSGGFAGASQRPQSLARLDAPTVPELDPATLRRLEEEKKAAELDAATPKFALPGGGVVPQAPSGSTPKFALPAAGEDVLICSNPACQKEVPGAKYGQKCPHCGIIWARQSTGDIADAASGGSSVPVDPKNPFARAAVPPPAAPAALPAGTPPAAAPVIPAAAPAQGFSLETIPWWGKVLGFGASIMVLMAVMGRR